MIRAFLGFGSFYSLSFFPAFSRGAGLWWGRDLLGRYNLLVDATGLLCLFHST
jgi:hypothetical protein